MSTHPQVAVSHSQSLAPEVIQPQGTSKKKKKLPLAISDPIFCDDETILRELVSISLHWTIIPLLIILVCTKWG